MQISIAILVGNANQGISYVKRLVKNFKARVLSYPNSIFEAEPCLVATLTELNDIELLRQTSLVVTPNAYNEGVLYDVIPNTPLGDMDVVRATTATRVNSAGLIEVVPRNLLQYSEQFNISPWLTLLSSSVTANTTTAPNGTTTADTLTFSANSSSSIYQTISIPQGQTTLSIYAKVASGTKQFRLRIDSPSANESSNFTATTEWQRFNFPVTTTGTGIVFYVINDSAGTAGSLFIWGAQLENFATATEYFPTTTRLNIPRIDYTNGSCPSLLVEPQRTNLLIYSNDFISYWSNDGTTTRTANAGISPDGTQNATKIVGAGGYSYRFAPLLSAGSCTFSIYLKSTANSNLDISINDFGGAGLTTKSILVTPSWQRFDITANITLGTTVILSFAGLDAGIDYYVYGAQLEVGAYPTSYIPTVASTVTRNADVISKTGISSLIGQTEGILFLDCKIYPTDTKRLAINDGTTANAIFFQSDATNRVRFLISQNSATILDTGNFTLANPDAFNKIAFKYKSNDFAIWVNGSKIYSSTAVALSFPVALSKFAFDFSASGLSFFGEVKSAQLYKTALTDEQLTLLTGDLYDSYAEMANSLNYILE
jgi:hypothetical protein